MNSISKRTVKQLNDRLLTQNVVLQTLIDIILENGLVTEKELEQKINKNIESTEKLINELHQESSIEFDIDEELEGLYFGPVGEA